MSSVVKDGRVFVFTWNNPPDEYPKFPDGVKYVYCAEVGDSGTPHWQGYVSFPKVKTFIGLKKLFPLPHWENRKGSHSSAYKYCIKGKECPEETSYHFHDKYYRGDGVPLGGSNMELSQRSGTRSDLTVARELVAKHGNYRDCINDPELDLVRAKYPNWIKELLAAKFEPNGLFVPRLWQQELLDVLVVPCTDDRIVHWYYDADGKAGKTVFGKYLVTNHNALYLTNCKTADAACIFDGHPIVVFNFTRSQSTRINYEVLEMLKDGILMSGKYHPIQKVNSSPHVVVFANFRPDESMLSADRWNIVDMCTKKRKALVLEHQGRRVFKGAFVEGFNQCPSVPAETVFNNPLLVNPM